MRTQYSSQKPWTPSQNHHSIETFIDLVQHDNEAKILNTKRSKDNLTKGEPKALEVLVRREMMSLSQMLIQEEP